MSSCGRMKIVIFSNTFASAFARLMISGSASVLRYVSVRYRARSTQTSWMTFRESAFNASMRARAWSEITGVR